MMELEVAEQCLTFLFNFRGAAPQNTAPLSMVDVRKIYSQMRGRTHPSTNDPQVISGVLQCALKDMTPCLLHDIYDDLIIFDSLDEKEGITKFISYTRIMLSKLSQRNFILIMKLCEVLIKSAQTASCAQLAANMAPYICRPSSGAFMSIRHMEDLRRIRPAIQFILENYMEVFDHLSSNEESRDARVNTAAAQQTPSGGSGLTYTGQQHPQALMGAVTGANNKKKTDFHAYTSLSADLHDYRSVSVHDYSSKNRTHDFESIEWKILETLVAMKVKSFLSLSASAATTHTSFPVAPIAPVSASEESKVDFSASLPSAMMESTANGRPGEKKPRRAVSATMTQRRLMIAECKAMKAQIAKFEQEWQAEYNRAPKENERGQMDGVYKTYRNMKRTIRNDAAIDIQRYFRGFTVRVRVEQLRKQLETIVPMDTMYAFESDFMNELDSETEDGGGRGRGRDTDLHSIESDNYSEDEVVQEKAIGSLAMAISGVGFTSTESDAVAARYNELLALKKQMKDKLKNFDDEFVRARGKAPGKKDKEVMRPFYEQYHEVKANLKKVGDAIHGKTARTSGTAGVAEPKHGLLMSHSDSKLEMKSSAAGLGGKRPSSSSGAKSVEAKHKGAADGLSKHRLVEEKKKLHEYLKTFEKNFTIANGRPVMHSDDIKPVAEQYKRYKELKSLTKRP